MAVRPITASRQVRLSIRHFCFAAAALLLITAAASSAGSVAPAFRPPVGGVITRCFSAAHTGIDFKTEPGSAVAAAAGGEVLFAGWLHGYGNTVIIDHFSGLTSSYSHLAEICCREGEQISSGQTVALSESSVLHFEIRINGEPVDPKSYLKSP